MLKSPSGPKRKGSRLERWVVQALGSAGLKARKQPGSGVYQDFPHDVLLELGSPEGLDHVRLVVECKSWKFGWRTGDKALGEADLLVMKRDYGEPAVYMPWKTFLFLAQSANTLLGVTDSSEVSAEVDAEFDEFKRGSGELITGRER